MPSPEKEGIDAGLIAKTVETLVRFAAMYKAVGHAGNGHWPVEQRFRTRQALLQMRAGAAEIGEQRVPAAAEPRQVVRWMSRQRLALPFSTVCRPA